MSLKTWVACAVFICLSFMAKTACAQSYAEPMELPAVTFDSNYLADYTGLFTGRAFLLFQNASLLINTPNSNLSKISYRPNVNVRVGLAGFWKWFGLGLSIDNPFFKTDRDAYGKTTTLDLRINAFWRFIAGEILLQ